ncbi:MAG: tRNA pseudouridine(38-40) synthase TruA [Bacteroidetes bacterium]|jgi:tRNA pseudouridine38-40 synthase|nr:tRNA pseudouridine(38-40) synthase TruA [Bacteroidota bacterium]
MRIALELKYDGGNYHGWQFQNNVVTVQEVIQEGLHKLLRKKTAITGCGRTDTGVHAKHFIAHFDYDGELSDDFVFRLNNVLPKDIGIDAIYHVPDNFNARFAATARTYKYHISKVKDPFGRSYSMVFYRGLDVDLMNKACTILKTHKEFGAFCKSHTQNKTNICDVTQAEWTQDKSMLVLTITANRFLRNMVRAIVGTLLEVGENKISLQEFEDIIVSQNRQRAGYSVPAQGLFLEHVAYNKTDWKKI